MCQRCFIWCMCQRCFISNFFPFENCTSPKLHRSGNVCTYFLGCHQLRKM
jgi:hypothetical protein